jgi:hypothetical protein
VWAGLLLAAPPARALNVHAVYRAACDRVLGVIMRVDRRTVHLLSLDGQMIEIPRHEIVSLAYYPVSALPAGAVPSDPAIRPLRVQAMVGGALVDLLEGWPIDYSEQKIAFLQRDGKELVVNRDSLWALAFTPGPAAASPAASPPAYWFVHPQAGGFCGEETAAEQAAIPVFPQQILNDEVVIKRELDRLQAGYEEILRYENDQKYYPVPQLYTNRTMLGIWLPLGSRYGASVNRTNIAPLLTDELSLGPFRYQHVFVTGSAPNGLLIHDEAQTQIFYRFKAAYFHASVFFDPSLLLLAGKYRWQPDDLHPDRPDDRLAESFLAELGFDFGPLAVEIVPVSVTESAIKMSNGVFVRPNGNLNLPRLGGRLTFVRLTVELWAGLSSIGYSYATFDTQGMLLRSAGGDVHYRYLRVNVGAPFGRKLHLGGSLIGRTTTADPEYSAFDLSGSARAALALPHRLTVEGYLGLEYQRARFPLYETDATVLYLKVGLGAGFAF